WLTSSIADVGGPYGELARSRRKLTLSASSKTEMVQRVFSGEGRMRLLAFVIFSSLVLMSGAAIGQAQDAQGTPPTAGLTNPQAISTFGQAIMNCLQSRLSGHTIAELGDGAAIRVRAAPVQDRWMAGPNT